MEARYRQDLSGKLPPKYQRVVEHLPGGGSILELGCHEGDFGEYLLEQGYSVMGIESDSRAADVARGRGLDVHVFDLEDGTTLPWPAKRFDVILAMDVLEHLRDPASVLSQLRANLSKQGLLIVTGPNVAYWANRLELLRGRWEYQEAGILDSTHLRFYTFDTWKALVSSAGFRVDAAEAAEGYLPLEHRLARMPGIGSFVKAVSRLCVTKRPNLFGCTVLLRCALA